MNKELDESLITIATALGFTVVASTVQTEGVNFGWLELRNEATGERFRWNPIANAGDRYRLVKAAGMMVNFADKGNFATAIVPLPGTEECAMLTFSKVAGEDVEAHAVVSLAHKWAKAKLALAATAL
jgi:hypothetical protein